jgi:hypothetical protein
MVEGCASGSWDTPVPCSQQCQQMYVRVHCYGRCSFSRRIHKHMYTRMFGLCPVVVMLTELSCSKNTHAGTSSSRATEARVPVCNRCQWTLSLGVRERVLYKYQRVPWQILSACADAFTSLESVDEASCHVVSTATVWIHHIGRGLPNSLLLYLSQLYRCCGFP